MVSDGADADARQRNAELVARVPVIGFGAEGSVAGLDRVGHFSCAHEIMTEGDAWHREVRNFPSGRGDENYQVAVPTYGTT